MKIAWLSTLIFCATLSLVAADMDLGPIIRIAQCRSTCLRYHMIDGNCLELNKTDTQTNDCEQCWNNCRILDNLDKEERHSVCTDSSYQNYQGRRTACTFFEIHGIEEEKYQPTKLPAPEEDETIYMDDYDIAVLMTKNFGTPWSRAKYYYAKQQPIMTPFSWVIIVTDDGVVKQYSWEKWRPKLESLKASGPLYQAYITWQDWRTQLNNQIKTYRSNQFIFGRKFETVIKRYETSFVVTWQQQTGDGIMGNQVTDSESAQISLPCGKYLVRIATNYGPGSYPIIIDTGICESPKQSIRSLNEYVNEQKVFLFVMGLFSAIIIMYLLEKYRIKKKGKENGIEDGSLTETEKRLMEERKLTKVQKNQRVPGLWPIYNHSANVLWVKETDTNINASVKAQDANVNAKVIQET